jgi:4-diphosphocytidyl-2-C-methyl-D-erythritol kinase
MLLYPNAKINIGLRIVEKRPDNYHNIETIFYPIALCDELRIEKNESLQDVKLALDGIRLDGDAESNLVVKAYRLLQNDFPISPVEITLKKNIPSGAGLGGGSSDAAFTLKALNEIFALNLRDAELENYAARLGADCAVFIRNRAVCATGIGNIFEPINLSLADYKILVVLPNVQVSTVNAYANCRPQKPETALVKLIGQAIEEWKNLIFNDFEKTVFTHFPIIAQIKQEIYNSGAVYCSMSGSGSAVYGIFNKNCDDIPKFENATSFIF